jgi:hypothetical protein
METNAEPGAGESGPVVGQATKRDRNDEEPDGKEKRRRFACEEWKTMTDDEVKEAASRFKRGPRSIRDVKRQVYCHPNFKDVSYKTRWPIELAVFAGASWPDSRENNRDVRDMWCHLYKGASHKGNAFTISE